jgi:hypothetical protein
MTSAVKELCRAKRSAVDGGILIRMRAKRAIIASQKARRIARLAQIPFDFAQGRLSVGKERLPQDDKPNRDATGKHRIGGVCGGLPQVASVTRGELLS